MTKEEAIEIIKKYQTGKGIAGGDWLEALTLAIQSLEAQGREVIDNKHSKDTEAKTEMFRGEPTSDTEYFIQGVKVTRWEWMCQNRINNIPKQIKELQEEYYRLTNK